MPSVGSLNDTLASSQLFYTDPIDADADSVYDIPCEGLSGSVVIIMIPKDNIVLNFCEVDVYVGIQFVSYVLRNIKNSYNDDSFIMQNITQCYKKNSGNDVSVTYINTFFTFCVDFWFCSILCCLG